MIKGYVVIKCGSPICDNKIRMNLLHDIYCDFVLDAEYDELQEGYITKSGWLIKFDNGGRIIKIRCKDCLDENSDEQQYLRDIEVYTGSARREEEDTD